MLALGRPQSAVKVELASGELRQACELLSVQKPPGGEVSADRFTVVLRRGEQRHIPHAGALLTRPGIDSRCSLPLLGPYSWPPAARRYRSVEEERDIKEPVWGALAPLAGAVRLAPLRILHGC